MFVALRSRYGAVSMQFWSADELLMKALSGEATIAPPQMYELQRLLSFDSIEEVKQYSGSCDKHGTERIFPVQIKCKDGLLRVLPGKYRNISVVTL